MARVHTVNSSRMEHRCGWPKGPHPIPAGEGYFWWQARYGPKYVRCLNHPPRQSETTTSKMAAVYAAIESVEDELVAVAQGLKGFDTAEDYRALLSTAAEEIRGVSEEYAEAAEAMGGAGEPMREMADNLDQFASELESETIEEFDDWKEQHENEYAEGEEILSYWQAEVNEQITSVLANLPE